jgi:quercetin dioxygenase-like cupin family protein
MDHGPIVSREEDRGWETWADGDTPRKGLAYWKTLISKGVTHSQNLTLGVATLPPGGAMREHRHRQEEVYLVLEGRGRVKVGDEVFAVGAGSAVFMPGDTLHSCENVGVSDLRVAYVFSADSFEEVEYDFGR